jgi:hypothetical protein
MIGSFSLKFQISLMHGSKKLGRGPTLGLLIPKTKVVNKRAKFCFFRFGLPIHHRTVDESPTHRTVDSVSPPITNGGVVYG